MQGTDLAWFRRLRAATNHEITAAGGITTIDEMRALQRLDIHAALGMAVYTGKLSLNDLACDAVTASPLTRYMLLPAAASSSWHRVTPRSILQTFGRRWTFLSGGASF